MRFVDGFWFGMGLLCAATLVGSAGYWLWSLTEPRDTAEPEPEEDPEGEPEDRRPEWMKSRSGKPYDPTAGYEPKRSRTRRSRGELTTPPET